MASRRIFAAALAGALAAVALAPPVQAGTREVRLLGEQRLAFGMEFAGTTVGGLSGVDYDPRTGRWYLISDDRSDRQPARFYTAALDLDSQRLSGVRITGTTPLLQTDGSTYPRSTVDPEDIRLDPWTKNLWWSQEGDRLVPTDGSAPTLLDPSIQASRTNGAAISALPLPTNLRMSAQDVGPRRNLTLEGMTFAAGGTLVVSAMEGPLLQDGPVPTLDTGALSRITMQTRTGGVLAQYVYPQEPISAPTNPPGGYADNGVPAILAADPLNPFRYLVLERSFITGVGNKVRLYEIDVRGATNVANTASLSDVDKVRPVRKRLLLDFDQLGLSKVDNIEGMAWGPRLRTGERTLVLVSDDNFSASQVTQFIALAVR